jgi:hypothetical protein
MSFSALSPASPRSYRAALLIAGNLPSCSNAAHNDIGDGVSRTARWGDANLATTTCLNATGPELLPNVEPELLELEYWLEQVGRDADLDEVLMTSEDIANHNAALLANQETLQQGLYDLLAPVAMAPLQTEINERLTWLLERLQNGTYVDATGQPLPAADLQPLSAVTCLTR